MDFAPIPNYSDLFENEEPKLKDLLRDIPSRLVIAVCCAMNAELHLEKDRDISEKSILAFFMQRQSTAIKINLYHKLLLLKQTKESVNLFATHYILQLIDYVFSNYKDFEIEDTTPDQELRIFKAYLLITDISNKKAEKNLIPNEKYNGEFFHTFTWPILAEQFETNTKVNPFTEMARGIVFLNYFQKHESYKSHLQHFLAEKKRKSPWHYVMDILAVIQESWKPNDLGILTGNRYRLSKVEDFESMFDPICLNIGDYSTIDIKSKAFTKIKSKPLFKYEDSYFVLDWNAFSGKLYEGLVFDFYKISGIAQQPIFSYFTDFKRFISNEITEKFLFQRLLKAFLTEKHTVLEFDRNKQDGFPDAYFRKGNKVLLFEIKDAYFPAKTITSSDYLQIKETIDQKYNNEKKGTGQFIKQLNYLKVKSFEGQKKYKSAKNLTIYPVIIYTDQMFALPGINDYLQLEFNKKIKAQQLHTQFKQIRPVTMISIRFFINHVNILKDRQANFFVLLDNYQKYLDRSIKKAKRNSETKYFFDIYQNFDQVITDMFPTSFTKRDDYVTTIFSALDLIDGLPSD